MIFCQHQHQTVSMCRLREKVIVASIIFSVQQTLTHTHYQMKESECIMKQSKRSQLQSIDTPTQHLSIDAKWILNTIVFSSILSSAVVERFYNLNFFSSFFLTMKFLFLRRILLLLWIPPNLYYKLPWFCFIAHLLQAFSLRLIWIKFSTIFSPKTIAVR